MKLVSQKMIFRFTSSMVGQPVIYHLVKEYDLIINILKADINPNQEGYVVLELSGSPEDFNRGVEYLKSSGVQVEPLSGSIAWNRERCLQCGACTTFCPTGALSLSRPGFEVSFNEEKCIVCRSCLDACMARAVETRI